MENVKMATFSNHPPTHPSANVNRLLQGADIEAKIDNSIPSLGTLNLGAQIN